MKFRLLRHAALILATAALLLGGGAIRAQNADSSKAERFQQLTRKAQAGETLTAEQTAFVGEVRADIQRRRGGAAPTAPMPKTKDAAASVNDKWEELPDGSLGQETEFVGVDGVAIPAYVRKPKGAGPFPVIVMMHGGKYGKGATLGLGRSMQSPTAEFIAAGWAVCSVDYRPSEKISIVPIEFDDTVEAVKTARKLPFADASRVGLIGGSHGGQVLSREGRAVDGFSMGGFGAAHLGFKFPEVFGVISIMAPPRVGPELTQPLPTRAWGNLFSTAMLNNLEYFRASDPLTLAEKNADVLRDRTHIRIVAHQENENWLVPQCEKLHQVLLRNSVQHEFSVFTNVKGHSPNGCTDSLGDAAYSFFNSTLPRARNSK